MKFYSNGEAFQLHYDNNLEAFNPEMWALESVAILTENMVAANLVHRDFEPMFARHGDVVNTRKPNEFVAKRKGLTDNVSVQGASAENIPVALDQHVHVSFLIRDGEETRAFKSLTQEYLMPATQAMARFADQMVLAQYAQFLANQSGSLGGLTSNNAVQAITETGLVMDRNKAYVTGRNQIWTPEAQSLIIQNPTFHQADRVGDDGTALRTASLGEKLNFRHWMAQNMSQVQEIVPHVEATAAVDNGAGYPVGTTTIHVDGFSADTAGLIKAGQFLSINGKVYQVAAAVTPATNEGDVTLTYGLKEAVENDDSVVFYTAANLVDNPGGYAAGYSKEIILDKNGSQADEIQVGQMLSFNNSPTVRYTVLSVDRTTVASHTLVVLDRPLVVGISENEIVNYGPDGGGFNLAFHRNAMTLAIRPLAPPASGTGAISGIAMMGGVTMRVVITYDGEKQGHLVTLDFLAGVKVLDTNLGAVTLT